MEFTESSLALIFKALGDPHRIRILKLLRNGETCGCNLLNALDISQPTLSHHMKLLCDAGIVKGRRKGKWMQYSINCETACRLRDFLKVFTEETLKAAGCCCEKEENNEENCHD